MRNPDMLPPCDYLQYLQEEVFGSSASGRPVGAGSRLTEFLRTIHPDFYEKATTHGEMLNATLREQLDPIVEALICTNPERSDLRRVPIGWANTKSMNAMAVAVPNGNSSGGPRHRD